MPTRERPEDIIVKLFASAYEDGAWKSGAIDWVDRHQDGGVEAIITRDDGQKLALEHTLVEFFIGERTDFERFRPFTRIEQDAALAVPNRHVYIDVPRGVLDGVKSRRREAIVDAVHKWLRANIRSLPSGHSMQTCQVPASHKISTDVEVVLQVRITDDSGFTGAPPNVRRYGPVDIPRTVMKALKTKLPKLKAAVADWRVLLLERNQWGMPEAVLAQEIEKQGPRFSEWAALHEYWIVETIASTGNLQLGHMGFKRYSAGKAVEEIWFVSGKLASHSKDGVVVYVAPGQHA